MTLARRRGTLWRPGRHCLLRPQRAQLLGGEMRSMKRRPHVILGVVAAILALAAIAAPVAAASPQSVVIVSHVTFNPNGPNYGDFATSGTAANTGLICPSGTFIDIGLRVGGFES